MLRQGTRGPGFARCARRAALAGCVAAVLPRTAAAEQPEALAPRPEPTPDAAGPREGSGPRAREPHYLRAAAEALAAIGIGTAHYWLNSHANSRDWDYPRWADRFSFDSIRFDNNPHATNNVLHPLAGAVYYGVARVNGISVGESIAFAQLASAIWEWGLEWREKVSINDMIVTSTGGTAAGEFFSQLAAYLNSAPAETNVGQEIAARTLGLPVWLHRELDGEAPRREIATDNLGFSAAYDHRFSVDLETTWRDDGAEQTEATRGVSLAAQLASVADFMAPVSFSAWFAQGNFTRAALDLSLGGGGLAEAELVFDAVLTGYYAQHHGQGTTGLLLGLGTGLEFVDRDTLKSPDQIALAHLTGPVAGLFYATSALELEVVGRLQADFAALRSLAFGAARARFADASFKSSLEQGGYQYHLGLSTRLEGSLRAGAALLSFDHAFGAYRSIEGLDRFQERISRDLTGSERLSQSGATLAIEPEGSPVRFFSSVERLSHHSRLGGDEGARLEQRLRVGCGLRF